MHIKKRHKSTLTVVALIAPFENHDGVLLKMPYAILHGFQIIGISPWSASSLLPEYTAEIARSGGETQYGDWLSTKT